MTNATNAKFFGFYTRTSKIDGRASVSLVDGRVHGFATEKTARAKTEMEVSKIDPKFYTVGAVSVMAFESDTKALHYLAEINSLVKGK